MASFMEKYHVSRKDYMNMPCALISLMMLDAPKVLYGKKLTDHTKEEIEEVAIQNRDNQPTAMSMAQILNKDGHK
ncbi:hypothetical protein M2132_001058 [Dysgonomonas sp. PH5-45]|nr:hypothetical protein [Dysgonomonas sp. PH5-45]MDH6387628.1 hypothetical protein [Dysgonomonas sp. PH5-37]